ncbi:MAG: dihydrofolate reductase family protein [Bacteroidota bacterium]
MSTDHLPIKLYIASSLDGYIAGPEGQVDWLDQLPNPNKIDYGYPEFYASIDTIIMGRKSYEAILGFDVPWPYPQCQTYVATRQANYLVKTERTAVLSGDLIAQTNAIQKSAQTGIWLLGGGALTAAYLNADLIDQLIIFIMPISIGSGIPLFPPTFQQKKWNLIETTAFETGAVRLIYEPQKKD